MKKLLLATTLFVAACGQSTESSDPVSAPTPPTDVEVTDVEDAGSEIIILADADTVANLVIGEGLTAEVVEPDTVTIGGTVTVGGGEDGEGAGGSTSGVAFKIGEATEAAVSGKRIRVTVTGKSADGGDAATRLAYSTADVGNSGWRDVVFTGDYSEQSFIYPVPTMENPRVDFLGVLPTGGPVVIKSIGIDFVEDAPAE